MGRRPLEPEIAAARRPGWPWGHNVVFQAMLLRQGVKEGQEPDFDEENKNVVFDYPREEIVKLNARHAMAVLEMKGWDWEGLRNPVLKDFLDLSGKSDNDDVFEFASGKGPLWWSGDPEVPFYHPRVLHEDFRSDSRLMKREMISNWEGVESCDLYRGFSQFLGQLIGKILGGPKGMHEAELREAKIMGECLLKNVGIGKPMERLSEGEAYSVLFSLQRESVHLRWRPGESTGKNGIAPEVVVCDGLVPLLAVETLHGLMDHKGSFFFCDNCSRLYFRNKKRPREDQQNYCDFCAMGGKGARINYRKKRKSAVETKGGED